MIGAFLQSLAWFMALGAIFSLLAQVRPAAPGQRVARAGLAADLTYWFIGPFFFSWLHMAFIVTGGALAFGPEGDSFAHHMEHGLFGLRAAPLWAQTLAALVITDVLQYWSHRAFHTHALWRYHAIHHGPADVDWLTCVRFHPVNVAVHSTAIGAFVVLLGFDPLVFAVLAPFNVVYSGLVHANVDWDFGPLRHVLASPAFHRWHHAQDEEAQDKNFAATFPVLDLMFGTYYLPRGRKPKAFGVTGDPVPETLLGQLLYPFRGARPRPEERMGFGNA